MKLTDLRCPLPHLVFLFSPRNAAGMEIDDKDRHASVTSCRVGAGQNEADIGDRGIVNPDFRSRQPPSLAIRNCGGLHSGNIRSCLCFGNAIGGAPLGREYTAQPL